MSFQVGTFRGDFNKLAELIKDEWSERRPDEEAPGGYGPSKEFGQVVDQLEGLRIRHMNDMDEKMKYGRQIDVPEIEAMRNLETLLFMAKTDPNHPNRANGMNDIQAGKQPGCAATLDSTKYQNYHDEMASAGPDSGVSISFKAF
jgi:hypothetical protein